MTKDQYICRRAANAILSEIGPYQISSDALQTINQFLDQVLALLLQNTQSFKPALVKSQLLALLPLSLGKNALVEAELEAKTYSETNHIHYPLYDEPPMNESTTMSPFPLEQAWVSLRYRCMEHSTLTEKSLDSPTSRNSNNNNNNNDGMIFSPVVIIYFTAILEHIAEYILTIIAITAEREGARYIRIKEVYSALVNDGQVGGLFKQTDLQSKLEKRVLSYQAQQQPPYQTFSLPSLLPSPAATFKNQVSVNENLGYQVPDLGYDNDHDHDDDLESESPSSSTHSRTSSSIKSGQSSYDYRSVSFFSNVTSSSSNRSSSSTSKRTFRFFGKKDKRPSTPSATSPQDHHRTKSPLPPCSPSPSTLLHHSNTPALDFEDLMRSGNTIKVSLTPNRLRSIEVKSSSTTTPQQQQPKKNGFFFNSSPVPSSPILSHPTPIPPFPPNGTSFENPRAAPKSPIVCYQPKTSFETPPLTPDSSIASRLSTTRSPSPSFEEDQLIPPTPPPPPPHQQQQQRTIRHPKHISLTPLQLSGRRSPQHHHHHHQHQHQRHRKQESIDTLSTDICAMDLPSPPSTMDHHPSSTIFNSVSDELSLPNKQPTYNRPSTMVAKRAASGMTRPVSCYENFAMGQQQQQQHHDGYTTSTTMMDLRSISPPPPPPMIMDPIYGRSTRRSTTRPSSTAIVEEDEEEEALDATVQNISSRMVNSSMQTDPLPGLPPLTTKTIPSIPTLIITTDHQRQQPSMDNNDDDDDDEEWFLEDDDWDDVQDQDSVMAEWLLGEA